MELGFVAQVLAPNEIRGSRRVERVERRPDESDSPLASVSRENARETERATGVALQLSPEAEALLAKPEQSAESEKSTEQDRSKSESGASASDGAERPGELSEEEEEEVRRLSARDAEVRAHENAHKAAAGRHARGGPSYEFERGPDGRRYAVGGEVSIDTSPVPNDPDATILKMQQVRRAALAPAEPSAQDRRVASEASQSEMRARSEKLEAKREERSSMRGSAYQQPAEDRRGESLNVIA